MGPPIRVGVALCLLFIVGGSFAGPLLTKDEPECVKGLPVGKTFVYRYQGVSKIENDDVNQEVNFSAEVVVSVPRECVLNVQLRNVLSPHPKFVQTLQDDAVEVRMDNGVLGQLQHSPSEPAWALNVKRAVLSMLQVPLAAREAPLKTDEKDVLGICKTNYQPVGSEGDIVEIEKTKQLLSCEGRSQSGKSVFYTPYDAPNSDIRTAPITDGSYMCHQSVSKTSGVIRKADCLQKEKLFLFQQASATPGVISEVTTETSLELIREEDGAQNARSPRSFRKGCIVFDHRANGDLSAEPLALTVNRHCDSMKADVRPESGKQFGDLLKSMRSASVAEISEVYQSLGGGPCDVKQLRKNFLDVLGMAGSTGSVQMIASFIQNGEHKEHHEKWLQMMAFITSATEEMVEASVPLVRTASAEAAKKVFLSVSAMANTFCKLHGDHCEQVGAVKQLLTAVVDRLGNGCSGERAVVVAALKALGNLGVTEGHGDKITKCMRGKPTDIRLYTLRAFRKVCDAEIGRQMLALYSNFDEDVEVRIAAYQNAVRCADANTLAKIVHVYENEKSLQVGSFVFSHLRVAHESECPLKAELKRLIDSVPISAKFSNDPSKFSQNFEYSKFFDSINMGSVADASVVFSPKSFLPRSLNLNLSIDLFSHSLNLFEVGGRVEGLERVFEEFLGHSGPARRGSPSGKHHRHARATKEDTDVALFDKEFDNKIAADEKMSFFMNIYGNEVDYVEFGSVKELTSKLITSALKLYSLHPSNLLSSLVLQSEVDVAKNMLLLDNTISTSTISGLGLVFDLRAVSNVALKASTPMPTAGGVTKASIEPSAVVQVDGSLTLNAGVFRHGSRFATTIHTSSVVEIEVTRRAEEFKFRFNTPRDQLEVLNAKSEVFVIHGDYETPIVAEKTRDLHGCTIQLPAVLGMTACVTGTLPKPWYMAKRGFVKPYNFALTLEKTDKSMEGIEFSLVTSGRTFSAILDTPGAAVDRRREIHFSASDSGYKVEAQCPRRSVRFEVSSVKEDVLSFNVLDKETNEAQEYALNVRNGLSQFLLGAEVHLEARCPHLQVPVALSIVGDNDTVRISSNYPRANPLNFTAAFRDGVVNMTVSVGELQASSEIEQNLQLGRNLELASLHTFFHTTYKLGSQKAEEVHYELKLHNEELDNGRHRTGMSVWTSTCHPKYNHKVAFGAYTQGENRKHKIQAWWGEDFEGQDKKFSMMFDSKKRGSFGFGHSTTIQLHSQIHSPAWGMDYEATLDSKIDLQKAPRITSELSVTSFKKALVKFEYTFDRHNSKTVTRASLLAPSTSLKLTDDSEEISPSKFKGTTNLEWGFEGKKLSVDYTCEIMQNGNHDLKLNIRAPNMKPIQHRHLIRIARDVTLKTETRIDGKQYLVFEVKKEDQSLAFNFVGQRLQVNYVRNVKDKAMDIKLDIQSKDAYTRPISLIIHKDSPGKRSHVLNVQFLWDAVANPDKKIDIKLSTEREDGVKSHVKITVSQYIDFEYKGTYAKGIIKGPNRAEFRLSGANIEARELITGHEYTAPKGEGYLTYSRGGKPLIDAKIGHEFTEQKRHYFLTMAGAVTRKLTITRDLTNRILTVDYDRDGKLYNMVVERKTDYNQGIVDTKITMKLPYEKFKMQQLTVNGTMAGGKVDLTIHYLSASEKNYHLAIKGTRPQGLALDVEIEIKSDLEKLKEGKAHLKYDLANAKSRSASLTVDRGSTRVFDFEFKTEGTDEHNREINFKLSSEFTSSYVGKTVVSGNKQSFTSKMTVAKNDKPYYTAENEFVNTGSKMSFKGKYQGGYFGGDTEIHFETNTLSGDNHRTYKLDLKRNERELKADAETQRTDGFKITSVNVCRTPLDADCISVTVKRNIVNFSLFRNNVMNVKIHRKPDVTLELDGQLHVPADVHKAHARLVGNINEFKLGFDYNCDYSNEQLSEQALRGFIVDRELLFTRRCEETDKFLDIKYAATFDAKSDDKLEATYRRDYNDKGYSSVAKLSHPKMRTPVVLKSKVSKGQDANSLYRIESELEFYKPEDTLYLHFERRTNDEIARNRSVHLHIHKADKSEYDLHVTLYRSEDLQKPVFAGYYWSYITAKKESRVGAMKAYLGEDLKGEIQFTSPYQDDFKITGQAKVINDEGDKEAEIVHLRNDVETKGKISYNLQKLYLKAAVLNADGTAKRELEVDGGRKEKGRYKVVLSSFPEGKQTIDVGIEHTLTSETSFHSRVYVPPDYLKRVAERAREIAASSAGKYPIETIREELKARSDAFSFRVRKTFEDVPEYILTKISQILVEIQGSLNRLINNTTVGQRLKERFEAHREKLAAYMKKFIELVRSCCPQTAERLEKMMEKYLPKRTRRSVSDEAENLVDYVMERVELFKNWLLEVPPVKLAYTAYSKVVDGLIRVRNRISEVLCFMKKEFLEIADVKQIADTWAELYDSSSVGYMLPREAVYEYVIKPRLEQYSLRMPVFEVDRKAGRFVADVDAPIDASKVLHYWVSESDPKEKQRSHRRYDLSSAVRMVKESLTKLYDAQATIIDGKHFITFDGKHFSAAGSCSYLLARDFVNGSFSVILKSGDVPSYVLQFGDKFFEVNADDSNPSKQITLNGEALETPTSRDHVVVLRNSDTIEIRDHDIRFKLNTQTKVATIEARLWLFGRTAGLLGNYNREPNDDLRTPSGSELTSEKEFLEAWQTKTCGGGETVLYKDRSEDVASVELCEKIFVNKESSLAIGFLLRRADEYHDLCLRVADVASNKVESVCRVAYAYLMDIERFVNIPGYLGARLPNECLTCELPLAPHAEIGDRCSGHFETGETADVIFALQDNQCNANFTGSINALVRALEKQLTARDVLHNRYGLVSFGGDGELFPTHLRTANGRLMFPARDMHLALNGMQMKSTSEGDIYLAVHAAITQYQFRLAATKILVLVTCHQCRTLDETAPDYLDLRMALLKRGVILHLISRDSVNSRTRPSRRTFHVLGLDAETVFTVRNVNQNVLIGSPEFKSRIRAPKDVCLLMALESSGSWFAAPRRSEQKAWRMILAKRISQDVSLNEQCLICDCQALETYSTRTVCKPCKPKRQAYVDYDDEDDDDNNGD